MKHAILILTLITGAISCSDTKPRDYGLEMKLHASIFKVVSAPLALNKNVVESHLVLNDNNEKTLFFDYIGGALYNFSFNDSSIIMATSEPKRFFYPIEIKDNLELMHTENSSVYLSGYNNNQPILLSGAGRYSRVWNATPIIIGDEMTLLTECGNEIDQSDVALCISRLRINNDKTIDLLSRDGFSLPGGGNAWGQYVEELDVSLILYGKIDETTRLWTIRAATLDNGVVTDKSDCFSIKSEYHLADPSLIEDDEGLHLTFSYNQKEVWYLRARAHTIKELTESLISCAGGN